LTRISKLIMVHVSALLLELIHRLIWRIGWINYRGLRLAVVRGVFSPKYTITTDLLADVIQQMIKSSYEVLDVGTGTGALAIIASRKARKVVAIDIDRRAVLCAKLNAILNGSSIIVKQGNLFSPLKDERFDVIIFNPPYLPLRPRPPLGLSVFFAEGALLESFLSQARYYLKKGGFLLMTYSTLSIKGYLEFLLRKYKWKYVKIRSFRMPLEEIYVIMAIPHGQ